MHFPGSGVPMLFLSDISWHALYQRPQHLAAGLAKHGPVLWVEPATLGHPVAWTPERISDNLHRISVPLFPHNARNRILRAVTGPLSALPPARAFIEMLQRRILRRALQSLAMPETGGTIVIENFQLVHLARSLRPACMLFDYIDDAFGFAAMPAYVRTLWEETVTTSTLVTVTAAKLQQQIAALRPGPVPIIRNGVEFDRFAADMSPRPADLPAAGTPVVGYVGSVYPWFDFELVAAAATKMPETHFVIIGPGHPDVADGMERLRRLPNVHVLGPRPYVRIPAYLRHFNAGIIPFRRNTLTESVNPVKLYEYAAAGIPTVTTFFADDLREFETLIHVAPGREEFLAMLPRALEQAGSPASITTLRSFARSNDWTARIDAIRTLLGGPASVEHLPISS
jgi:glycosyltransferase involved in cell wall biosynthesis